jgi:hypothetical protein
MPKLMRALRDTDETVVRPVMLDIVRQVLDYTGLKEEEVQIFYPGTENKTFQPGSSISKESIPNQLKAAFYNQAAIEIDEQYDKDRVLSTAVFKPENLFIFRDDFLEVAVKPTYSTMDCSINIRFRAVDKVTAIRWRDELRQRVSMGRLTHLHTVTYNYFFPPEYIYILQEIHRLRENVAGFGTDWDTYFGQSVTPKATQVVNIAGNLPQWTIPESQMRIVGFFDFDGAPEQGSREEGGETWTVTVAYKFKYDKPVGAVMEYPLMFHNQLIGQEYRPEQGPYEVEAQQRAYSWSTKNFAMFETSRPINILMSREGVQFPTFDEFVPPAVWPNTTRVITILLQLDPSQPNALINLAEQIGPYQLDADVLGYMKGEAQYMTTPYASMFSLSLYENHQLLDKTWLSVDSQLNVTAAKPLSFRHYYHLRLAILNDLSLLNPGAKKRARGQCAAMVKLLDTVDPMLKQRGLLPVCLPGNWMPDSNWNDASSAINNPTIATGNSQTYGVMKTVGVYSIIAYRGNQNAGSSNS